MVFRMSTPQRFELEQIRDEQKRIHRLVSLLDNRIDLIAPITEPETLPEHPIELEPAIVTFAEAEEPPLVIALPEVVSHESHISQQEGTTDGKPGSYGTYRSSDSSQKAHPTKDATAPADAPAEPMEMRLGKFWMARLGIVILLTGLVFLGNYAYQMIVPKLGAMGKLTLLAMAGGALGGIGFWLERSRETMKNYAHVLIAGGGATLYYTGYAAHFVERLRVIESPVVGGMLLLGFAGTMIWFADRRRSEMVALLAVLLSYYTSAINAIGGFSLFSNLLLTAVALYFLLKRQWTKITVASLIGTYGSYVFWRMGHPTGGLEIGMGFLGCYWVFFTAAALLATAVAFRPADRIAFLTINNGVFFLIGAQQILHAAPQAFWMFSAGYGAVLLTASLIARRLSRDEPAISSAYYVQGVLLATVGLISKFTGQQLAIILALESALLLGGTRWRYKVINEIGAVACGFGAFLIMVVQIHLDRAGWLPGALVAGVLLFNSIWKKHLDEKLKDPAIDATTFAFSSFGLILFGVMINKFVPTTWQPIVFALSAAAGLLPLRFWKLSEIAFTSQLFLGAGAVLFVSACSNQTPTIALSPIVLILSAVGLLHWWQRQQTLPVSDETRTLIQTGFACVGVVVGVFWMTSGLSGDALMVVASLVAIGTLIYGALTRAWMISLAGQVFTFLSVYYLITALVMRDPGWAASLVPIANLLISSALVAYAKKRAPQTEGFVWETVAQCSAIYRYTATLLVGLWGLEFITAPMRPLFFAALGSARLALGGFRRDREESRAGLAYAFASLLLLTWQLFEHPAQVSGLLALIALFAGWHSHRALAKGLKVCSDESGNFLRIGALVALWLWVTRWTVQHGGSGKLTIAWVALTLVLFGVGFGMKERLYRMAGIAMLGLAIGRLFFVDVWGFDSIYRIISFLLLGVVLLAISYFYNRFADNIRKWL